MPPQPHESQAGHSLSSGESGSSGSHPILILGPTASGKSELAVALAESLPHAQIISADSMQVYRHMDAGTAKPHPDLRRRITHHLVDTVEPTDRFTVADWLEQAETLITQIQLSGGAPIIVGGTNLYIQALLQGLFEGPPQDLVFRARTANATAQQLHTQLTAIDPAAANRIHPNDHKRLTRALEVYHLTGRPISEWQSQWSPDPVSFYRHNPILIGLEWPIDVINKRINARSKAMFYPEKSDPDLVSRILPNNETLPDETSRLMNQNLLGPQSSQGIGYKQIIDHIQGHCTLEQAFEKTKIQTRRFAKNQRTWLRRFSPINWLPVDRLTPLELLEKSLAYITHCNSNS